MPRIIINNRKYIRVPFTLPVSVLLVDKDANLMWQTVYQGFTRDINDGGLCVDIVNFDDKLAEKVLNEGYSFLLNVDLPNSSSTLSIPSQPKWIDKSQTNLMQKYKIGVFFTAPAEKDTRNLVKYAASLNRRPRQIFLIGILFAAVCLLSFVNDVRLKFINVKLNKELFIINDEKKRINLELLKLEKLKSELEQNLNVANQEIINLSSLTQKSAKAIVQSGLDNIREMKEINSNGPATSGASLSIDHKAYETKLKEIDKNRNLIKKKLIELVQEQEILVKKQDELESSSENLADKKVALMYNWIKNNQSPLTGLVCSYKGDSELENIAFTYDQALCILNFIEKKDLGNAKRLIDFFVFKARKSAGVFLNAYHVNNGGVMEWTVHVGPNAWLAMAILKYIEATEDRTYLKDVYNIANFIISLQDRDGGIKGGTDVNWYSTEHNLDAYALFRMMFTLTNNPKFKLAYQKVLDWLINDIYIKDEFRFKRGKNDGLIATDTASFGIPAIGAKMMYQKNIDPEKMIEFMEKKTKVEVNFTNNEGEQYNIKGFDYTNPDRLGRKGVVSSEWTAQMVTTYQVMADYFKSRDKQKYKYYKDKANFYMKELEKMLISAECEKFDSLGLPYATGASAETGHGWVTPRSPYAVSIAGTAYTLLAKYKINPFCLNQEKEKHYL